MKKVFTERSIVVFLFVLVMVLFTLAERDSKKLIPLYTGKTAAVPVPKTDHAAFPDEQPAFVLSSTRN